MTRPYEGKNNAKRKRYVQQQGLCVWCGLDMWFVGIEKAGIFMARMGLKYRRQLPGYHVTIEHIIPTAKGGANAESNLVCACSECNNARRHLDDFEPHPAVIKHLRYAGEHAIADLLERGIDDYIEDDTSPRRETLVPF